MKKMIVNFCSLEIASIGFVKIRKLKANRQGMVQGKEFKCRVGFERKSFCFSNIAKKSAGFQNALKLMKD